MTWAAVLALAAGTYAMKAAGPLALGSRALPAALQRAFSLLAVTLLAALIAVSTFTAGTGLVVDARAAGVAAGAVALALRAPFAVVVGTAAAVAAGVRALG